jgi:hypothetical protein
MDYLGNYSLKGLQCFTVLDWVGTMSHMLHQDLSFLMGCHPSNASSVFFMFFVVVMRTV